MAENLTRLVLRVEDEQGDQEGLAELADGLRQELLDLDVDSVEQLSAREAPPGSVDGDVLELSGLPSQERQR